MAPPIMSSSLAKKKKTTKENATKKTIFVTVGTTLFEALMDAVIHPTALQGMVDAGYTDLILQYGKGRPPVLPSNHLTAGLLNVVMYSFKPSLRDDMLAADLIVSHAGAGTVMEAVKMHKKTKIVVVINDALMDNHQAELAYAMAARKYVLVLDQPSQLVNKNRTFWTDEIGAFEPALYEPGDPYDFPRILDHFMGFASKSS